MTSTVTEKLDAARQAAMIGLQMTSGSDKDKDMEHNKVYTDRAGTIITTTTGARVVDDNNAHRAGERGPLLMEDVNFREKITHFDHEAIPERVVHARGSGAHGYFQVYENLSDVSKAVVFADPSHKTPVFVRFSTVLGSRGSADTVRDVRGFATKFYTPDGNWDLVGNNIPVFFIQDAVKFPDIIHAGKPEPHNEIPQAQTAHDNLWDFLSLQPETAHMMMWAMSDRAIPRSFRMMQGFGVNTYTLINAEGKRRFVKFHWRPLLGVHSLAWDECVKLNGVDPDFHRRDLWEAIESGNFPQYELGLQLVDEADENKFEFDILDATKLIPEELVPIRWVGRMTLNRNPTDFQAETEQVAFCVQNIIPGIDFSDDPLLQGRTFSYVDTNVGRHRTPNFNQLPINRPICPVLNNFRGGHMQMFVQNSRVNYFPNRFGVPTDAGMGKGMEHYAEKIHGMVTRLRGPKFSEHFSQAMLFYNSLSPHEREHLANAFCFELSRVDNETVRTRVINELINNIDHDLAKSIASRVGVDPPPAPTRLNHGKASARLSQLAYSTEPSIATRKIGLMIADGYDAAQLMGIRAALKQFGAITLIIGPRKRQILPAAGKSQDGTKCDFLYTNSKSVLFDSLVVIGGEQAAKSLVLNGDAIAFINEAYKHWKPIGAVGHGVQLLHAAALPGVRIASPDSADQVVQDHGVVSAFLINDGYGGSMASAAAGAAEGEKSAGMIGAAITSIKKGLEALTLQDGGGKWINAYVNAVAQHRFWERDVTRVPA